MESSIFHHILFLSCILAIMYEGHVISYSEQTIGMIGEI